MANERALGGRPSASSTPSGGARAGGEREDTAPSAPPTAGYFLGRYRIVDEIGVGGMASVHLARADGPGGFQKWVAIKRIHSHFAEDDGFIRMFLDEARIAARISHPNVAQVFDLGKHKGTYWIAMEYLHGEPLREVIRAVEEDGAPRFSPELAAKIIADAAEGLHSAHELRDGAGNLLGVVHRDVSPQNLFLTFDGAVKVVDFGVAKVQNSLGDTRAGTLKGKVAYMSPEHARGAPVDRRTDVFALGVVLWELITSRRLFRVETDYETIERVKNCAVPRPSTLVPGLPPELERIVLRALEKEPERRFQTARELSRELSQYVMRSGRLIGPEEIGGYLRRVLSERFETREAHLSRAAEATRTLAIEDFEIIAAEEESLLTELSEISEVQPFSPAAAKLASAAAARGAPAARSATPPPVSAQRLARPAAGRPPSGPPPRAEGPAPRHELPSYDEDDEAASTRVADSAPIPPAPRAPNRTLLGIPGPRPAAGVRPAPVVPAPPRAPSLTPKPPIAARTLLGIAPPSRPAPPPPPPVGPLKAPLPNFPLPAAAGAQGYQEDDDAVTRVRNSPLESHYLHVPAKKAQPAPLPSATFVVAPEPTPPPAPTLPANLSPYAPLPSVPPPSVAPAPLSRGLVALLAATTTLIALALIALVVLKISERSGPPATNASVIAVPVRSDPTPVATPAPPPSIATAVAAKPIETGSLDLSALPAEKAGKPEPKPDDAPKPAAAAPKAVPGPMPKATGPAPKPIEAAPPVAASEPPAAGGPGFLTIVCDPSCSAVVVDGRSLGPSPVVHVSVAAGSHSVLLRAPGLPAKAIGVKITSGKTTAQRVKMGS